MKHYLLIPLFFFFLFLSMPAMASTITLDSSNDLSDSYMAEAAPTTNYGTTYFMSVTTQPSSNYYSIIKFNTSLIPSGATINSATLYLYKRVGPVSRYHQIYNVSNAWNETNITWNNMPSATTLNDNKSTGTSGSWVSFNVTLGMATYSKNQTSFLIKDSIANSSTGYSLSYDTKENGNFMPYMVVNFTLLNNCTTEIIGTYCDPIELAQYGSTRVIVTTPDYTCLNDKSYLCPSGSLCTQITPQVNITTPLIENFTDCSKCFYVYALAGILGNPPLLKTNCPNNPECNPGISSNGSAYFSSCLWGPLNPLLVTCPGVFTTPSTTTPASFEQYTAGCYDPTIGWVPIAIDQNGNQTTINDLTISIFGNNTTLATPQLTNCPNSTTSCYIVNNSVCVPVTCTPTTGYSGPNSITSLGAAVNSQLGTPYGTSVISFMASAALGMFIFIKTKGKKLEAFIVPFFLVMGGFSMPGVEFFPIWIFLVMVVFSGVLIFWKARG